MKTVDLVPGILSGCFLRKVPTLSSDIAVDDLSSGSSNRGLVNIRKLDVLQYVQFLRWSTKLDSIQIYNTVSNHLESLGISGSRNCVRG